MLEALKPFESKSDVRTSSSGHYFIRRARQRVLDADKLYAENTPEVSFQPSIEQRNQLALQLGKDLYNVLYEPYIQDRPFLVDLPPTDGDGVLYARQTSASIIFNLTLVEHLLHRNNSQVVSLYQLAVDLILSDRTSLLLVALINNMGVYHYENNMTASKRYMEHLRFILHSTLLSDREAAAQLCMNVRHILEPHFTVSPAA